MVGRERKKKNSGEKGKGSGSLSLGKRRMLQVQVKAARAEKSTNGVEVRGEVRDSTVCATIAPLRSQLHFHRSPGSPTPQRPEAM